MTALLWIIVVAVYLAIAITTNVLVREWDRKHSIKRDFRYEIRTEDYFWPALFWPALWSITLYIWFFERRRKHGS